MVTLVELERSTAQVGHSFKRTISIIYSRIVAMRREKAEEWQREHLLKKILFEVYTACRVGGAVNTRNKIRLSNKTILTLFDLHTR